MSYSWSKLVVYIYGTFYRSQSRSCLPRTRHCINNLQEPDSSPGSLNRPEKEFDRGIIISSSPQTENQAKDEEGVCQNLCLARVIAQLSRVSTQCFKTEGPRKWARIPLKYEFGV